MRTEGVGAQSTTSFSRGELRREKSGMMVQSLLSTESTASPRKDQPMHIVDGKELADLLLLGQARPSA